MREEHSPLWHLRQFEPDTREQELRDFLGGFDFRGEMTTAAVDHFSGGEKARLTLALIVRQKPNLLLLDEPTNHLDIEMREALTESLQDYGGALIVVAHDRHLLRATTDALWLVAGGKITPFDGDLDDYRDWVLNARRRERAVPGILPSRTRPRSPRSQNAEARGSDCAPEACRGEAPAGRQQTAIEREMSALTSEKDMLDAWLASPAAYAERAREDLKAKVARQGELTWQLARLETQWLEVAEALERVATMA